MPWLADAGLLRWKYQELARLATDLDESCALLADDQLRPNEQLVLAMLRQDYAFPNAAFQLDEERFAGRTFHVGIGPHDGWTDGENYIAISRGFLEQRDVFRPLHLVELVELVRHEYAHADSDITTHVHGEEFYRRFHDLGSAAAACIDRSIKALPKLAKRLLGRLSAARVEHRKKLRACVMAGRTFREGLDGS